MFCHTYRSLEDDISESGTQEAGAATVRDENHLIRHSCHDSGIDITDPNAAVLPAVPTKKNYSDADIVLSSDWVPPLTIAPTLCTDSPSSNTTQNQQQGSGNAVVDGGRKKTSSVSFSVDDNSEQHSSASSEKSTTDNRKNKMLKRLSYPLTWVEGLTGDGKPNESTESAPNTGDSNQSVFSKVFSRYAYQFNIKLNLNFILFSFNKSKKYF